MGAVVHLLVVVLDRRELRRGASEGVLYREVKPWTG